MNHMFDYQVNESGKIELLKVKEEYLSEVEFLPGRIDGVEIVRIGPNFNLHSSLNVLNIPESVVSIAGTAFKDNDFTHVHIGSSLSGLYPINAFSRLKKVTVSDGNPYFEEIGGNVYRKHSHSLELYFGNEIHSSCQRINSYAVFNRRLSSIEIPCTAVDVAPFAFYKSHIDTFVISDELYKIQRLAISECTIEELSFIRRGYGDCKLEFECISNCSISKLIIDGAVEFDEQAISFTEIKNLSIRYAYFNKDSIYRSILLKEIDELKSVEIDFSHLLTTNPDGDISATIRAWLELNIPANCPYYKGERVNNEWIEVKYW